MLHHMKLQAEPFQKIRSGMKTVELRLNDEKRQSIREGDQIEFLNLQDKDQKIRVEVRKLHHFPDFQELYRTMDMTACGYAQGETPRPEDMEQYYTPEQQAKYGVLGIEIALIPWMDKRLEKISRYISMLLRHKPWVAGLEMDSHGWVEVSRLLKGVNKTHHMTMEMLEQLVSMDSKGRYAFSPDKTRIRANQGHSIPVDVELEVRVPPEILWHGTGEKYVPAILTEGLRKKKRLYVHLSGDYRTAVSVGSRHGKPVVFQVDAASMYQDGYLFYQSANHVWLTEAVPPQYLHICQQAGREEPECSM